MNYLPVVTILLMALSTYFTRILGYLLLRNRQLSPRMQAIMDAAPGCILITIISPYFVTDRPADLLALAISLFAASRWGLLPVVLIAVMSTAVLRFML
ncbi:AzlD family protein [Rosenbergiella metrosideri]|uniref:AzlD family protein n=1 Tax=Rosenbergiella metrosideri TaxID=2921185 RepID=UPI001F4FE1E4